ncbi:MAG: T9SS type A sorting domain-containing protein [Bacteroidetes bacterium]|nr:T9SS type A sorting domain-containing protein [Bacteroidota bacterium]
MKFITQFLFIILLFITGNINSQNWLKIDSVFAVSGVTVNNFSAPFFGDIDNDGDLDLLIGSNGDKTELFLNNGKDFPATFVKDTSIISFIYAGGIQGTNSDYPCWVDLDNDGDLDLVIGGYNGLIGYENIGSKEEPEYLKLESVFASVNPQIGGDPKPAFADLDNDGDVDLIVGIGESFVAGPAPGITLGFRNNGSSQNPNFVQDNSLVTGIPDIGLNAYPALADLDNDNDYDLLFGRDGGSLYFYKNTGTPSQPVWTRDYAVFASVESSSYWKNPTFADLDYDNDLDLIYGTSSGAMYVHKNIGYIMNPIFQYYPNYFKVIKLNGNGASVSLADYDNDGDYDLLSGIWTGKIIYFKNAGTNQKPEFIQTNMPFSNLEGSSYSTPVFVDIDSDGDYDIVTGGLNGKLSCYINNSGSFTANATLFGFVSAGYSSVPTFADLDDDGDQDLLVGSETGSSYRFYENKGSNVFEENTTMFAGISFPNYSSPKLADVDNDGDIDLVVGRISGSLDFYENKGNKQKPEWLKNNDLFAGISVKQSPNADFADLDGDRKPDMIVGEYNGNFTFYKNLFAVTDVENENGGLTPSEFVLNQNYPNPFNPSTVISYSLSRETKVSLKVYDILGVEIATLVNTNKKAGSYDVRFDAVNLPSGIYFLTLTADNFSQTKKMSLIK